MLIKNIEKLATNDVRRDALEITEAGYDSIRIKNIIGKTLTFKNSRLEIKGHSYDITSYKNIFVLGVGKSSGLICAAIEDLIGAKNIKSGATIDLKHRKLSKIKVFAGSHPLPTKKNVLATGKLISIAKSAGPKDLVITVICGGGSALACSPLLKNDYRSIQTVYKAMMLKGAKIDELNTVRKHLDKFHGGFLASYLYPATVLGLIISDIPGNEIDMVASGPTSLDKSNLDDAKKILKKYSLEDIRLTKNPTDPKYFKKVNNIMLAGGTTTLEAMQKKSVELGYKPAIFSKNLQGLASEIGPKLAETVKPGEALLACGETTVIVKKPGKGGRNQDLALSALPYLKKDSAIVSAASDGKDNIDVAGGITDSNSYLESSENIEPVKAVANNESFEALRKINGIFHINKVTANVSDFIVVLRKE